MKKQLWSTLGALAIMGSSTAMADNSVYGEFRGSLSNVKAEDATGADINESHSWDNNASRVGFKGETKNGVFYRFEMGLFTDTTTSGGSGLATTRLAYAGMKGKKWGKIAFGTQSTPYKKAGKKMDPFYDTSAVSNQSLTGVTTSGASFGFSNMNNGFSASSLNYWSPEFFGVRANVGTVFNDSNTQPDLSDDYNFGLQWSGFGATVGAQFLTIGNGNHFNANSTAVGCTAAPNVCFDQAGATGAAANATAGDKWTKVHASYGMANWGVNVNYEMMEDDVPVGSTANDEKYMQLNGWYKHGKHKVALGYGTQERDTADVTFDGKGMNVGYWHECGEKTNIYVLYSNAETDDNAKNTVISLGFNHAFDATL